MLPPVPRTGTPVPPPRPPVALDPAAAARWRDGAHVLDARDESAFATGHVPAAGRMTVGEFAVRRAELPPRTARVLVVHAAPSAALAAADALVAMGYRDVAHLAAPLAAWPGGAHDTGPAARLWSASPFLVRMQARLAPGRSLDVACGTARESVHLALAGWEAEAWDHDPSALARAEALAARSGTRIATRCVRLDRPEELPAGRRWNTIVVCRYLDRALFPWLERALAPGGTLVYETFRRGQERHGHPLNARYLLEARELERAFPTLEVLAYEESEPAGGPVMAHLLARAREAEPIAGPPAADVTPPAPGA